MAASCSIDDDQTNFKYTTLKTVNASLPDTFELVVIENSIIVHRNPYGHLVLMKIIVTLPPPLMKGRV